jgi:transposase
LDGVCFQIFLEQLASEYLDNLNVVQLDYDKFPHSNNLKISDKILQIFQPPYSAELNPIERVWQHIKQELRWKIYDKLDEIKEKLRAFIENFSLLTIASITGWDYIRSVLATVA